jgi:N-acetyl-anhydromuramoyl-L-alanine amidase
MTIPTEGLHLPLWTNGWYRFAHALPSPNFGPRPAGTTIDLIVVHSISLPPGEFGGDAVQRLFANQLDWDQHPYYKRIQGIQVSAHFYIRRNGDLWQFVALDQRAWHAGESSFAGRDNCNDFSVGIEMEGLEGGLFESDQYETLSSLCNAISLTCPIEHITGHEHVAPGRKFDPGAGFDWLRLQHMMAWKSQCFPAL